MKKTLLILFLTTVVYSIPTVAGNWTTLNAPGAVTYTEISGIDGDNIVGNSEFLGPFLYNGTNWTAIPIEGNITGIDNGSIVGYSPTYALPIPGTSQYSFVYNGNNLTSIEYPEADFTYVHGIDGTNLAGVYNDSLGRHGFLYDSTNWTTIDAPAGYSMNVYDVDGSNLVGFYDRTDYDTFDYYCESFIYDGVNWTLINFPGADYTRAYGIDGENVVGSYVDSSGTHGFFYDGADWMTLDFPGADGTEALNIDGDKIVGSYQLSYDFYNKEQGFIYEIPEPTTLLLLGLGGIALRKRRKA